MRHLCLLVLALVAGCARRRRRIRRRVAIRSSAMIAPRRFRRRSTKSPTAPRRRACASPSPPTSGRRRRPSIPFRGDQVNGRDGFSPATPFVVYFKNGVDTTQLPTDADLTAALTASLGRCRSSTSPTGQRVPLFAELDAAADPTLGDRQALLIHPMARLAELGPATSSRSSGCTIAKGNDLTPARFRALRDKTRCRSRSSRCSANYEELFAALAAAGVPRDKILTLAWDVVTAERRDVDAAPRTACVDTALRGSRTAAATTTSPPTNDTAERSEPVARDHRHVPCAVVPHRRLADADARARRRRASRWCAPPARRAVRRPHPAVRAHRDQAAADHRLRPRPLRHGAERAVDATTRSRSRRQLCMVQIGTDWIGLAHVRLRRRSRQNVVGDLNQFPHRHRSPAAGARQRAGADAPLPRRR